MAQPDGSSGGPQTDASFADVYEQVMDKPCSLDKINVSPAELQTRLLLILREFREAERAQTFNEVVKCTTRAVQSLEELGVFRKADARLMPGESVCLIVSLHSFEHAVRLSMPISLKSLTAFKATRTRVGNTVAACIAPVLSHLPPARKISDACSASHTHAPWILSWRNPSSTPSARTPWWTQRDR
jgi:hypothetical protein